LSLSACAVKTNLMNLKNYKPTLNLLLLAGIAYLIHKLIFYLWKINGNAFLYPMETIYLLFLGMSILVFTVVLKVKEQNFDNIGMSFLLATTVKMVFCYLILKPILRFNTNDNSLEKVNFFSVFVLFLTIETVLTIRILNKKQ
jgi:glucose uptake protein GlcU